MSVLHYTVLIHNLLTAIFLRIKMSVAKMNERKWMSDREATSCAGCTKNFSVTVRRVCLYEIFSLVIPIYWTTCSVLIKPMLPDINEVIFCLIFHFAAPLPELRKGVLCWMHFSTCVFAITCEAGARVRPVQCGGCRCEPHRERHFARFGRVEQRQY